VGRNFFRARPEMVPLDLELVARPKLGQPRLYIVSIVDDGFNRIGAIGTA